MSQMSQQQFILLQDPARDGKGARFNVDGVSDGGSVFISNVPLSGCLFVCVWGGGGGRSGSPL